MNSDKERKLKNIFAVCLLAISSAFIQAQTVVFWQRGFPSVDSEPVEQASLCAAFGATNTTFADIPTLNQPSTLSNTDLLVLPYGSAVPTEAWQTIRKYLEKGGNLLILGGEPLHVPVSFSGHAYEIGRPQDSYARVLGLGHVSEIPTPRDASFVWKSGYDFGSAPKVQARRFFSVEGRLNGLGYMKDSEGQLDAAPVVVIDKINGPMRGSRIVALDFDPTPNYWRSLDGISLIRQAAEYARHGATQFSVECLFSMIRPQESPQLSLHLQRRSKGLVDGEAKVELISNGRSLESGMLPLSAADSINLPFSFHTPLVPGFYQVLATYFQHQQMREFYQNGFWVAPPDALSAGSVLGVNEDFLTKDGRTFFPVGTNYFTTEENGWDFSGPRNASVWETDFNDMETHGVTFVRTGVWMPNSRFIDGDLGGANERFLRNLEAYLLSAQRHKIAVNFTFFAFSPKSGSQRSDNAVQPNPYLDPEAVIAQQAYVRSIVNRFRNVPWLSWDLINEPSFSNPNHIFRGNYPNDDPLELAAWRSWLRHHYTNLSVLADAWSVTPDEVGEFDTIPLPSATDLIYERYGNPAQVRALDYNLFAQDAFSGWVKSIISTIRGTGSTQLIDVGQDEGGITDRVLNQFYATSGVSFTTNHTYWRDDALLWDSVVAKRPGMPNITGETGYQPAWSPDGAWRYDELAGLGLTERKWALGFAAGSSGTMQWDWAREVDFGMQRSDGSAKVWQNMMRDLGRFAAVASSHAAALIQPEIAIVLPQSLQLSVLNSYALVAQQNAVRALYQQAHGQAYAVGEYQIDKLGNPKLILLPSPMGLTNQAWNSIENKVRTGTTLLITGPFEGDAHLHPTSRQEKIGLHYTTQPLGLREQEMRWPGGNDVYTFPGQLTTVINIAHLENGEEWQEVALGKGKVLFSSLPLELSDNQDALGRVYAYAMREAGVKSVFAAEGLDPGILICPTSFSDGTLYVLTSETKSHNLHFRDNRSGKEFSGELAAGRASLLMIGKDGALIASYNWAGSPM